MGTTFTIDELQAAINEVILIDSMFPNLPIKLPFCGENDFWQRETFPLTFKKIGKDEDVTVRCEEFYVGGGLEEDGNSMYCVLTVGYGDNQRYFKKSGFLDSWDNGLDDYRWDGGFFEVKAVEVTRKEYQAI